MYYSVATKEDDIESGFPEYSEEVKTKEELTEVAKRVVDYGVPLHRVSVTECLEDNEVSGFESQFDDLGTLEEVLEGML
jgi:hypothetical protein